MYPLSETSSPAVLFAIVLVAAIGAPFAFRRGDAFEIGAIAALVAAAAYTVFEMTKEGFGALSVLGLGLTFLFYLPPAILVVWLIRRLQRTQKRT